MRALTSAGTFSKDTRLWGLPSDLYAVEGNKARVKLSNGKWYLDWVSALGANLLGYDTSFLYYVSHNIMNGTAFSLGHELEYSVADKLASVLSENVPGWDAPLGVRFCKTGSEATTMAVKMARALTGYNEIVTMKNAYHGWNDWTICRTRPAWGVPVEEHFYIYNCEWGDIEDLEGLLDCNLIAAVIFEHPVGESSKEWYVALRELTEEHNTILIADEVVTGLRYGMGGACQRYGISPDLICLGKSLGNGFPIAGVIGDRGYFEMFARKDPVFCSSTSWGETASLKAAEYVLCNWNEDKISKLWKLGDKLKNGLADIGWNVIGDGARSVMQFDFNLHRAYFIQGMFERGILMNRPNFPNMAHTEEDVEETLAAAKEVMYEFMHETDESITKKMEGKLPMVLFERR